MYCNNKNNVCKTIIYSDFYFFILLLFLGSIFGSSQKTVLTSIDNDNNLNNVNKLREELKNLMTEVNLKKKEIDKVVINEEGLKKNIKHLEDIIKKKVWMFF